METQIKALKLFRKCFMLIPSTIFCLLFFGLLYGFVTTYWENMDLESRAILIAFIVTSAVGFLLNVRVIYNIAMFCERGFDND